MNKASEIKVFVTYHDLSDAKIIMKFGVNSYTMEVYSTDERNNVYGGVQRGT